MNAAELAARREPVWKRLADLVEGPARKQTPPADAADLARLYRQALADLGRLRTLTAAASPRGSDDSPTVTWLNEVVARAHGRIYLGAPVRRSLVRGFFAAEFPRRFRAALPRIALAAGVFAASALVTYLLCAGDPAVARGLGGPALTRNAEAFAQIGSGRALSSEALMSSFYVSNNVSVAFLAFAAGITAGLGTLYMLVANGMAMGLTFALVTHFGFPDRLGAFVAAHGPIELLAIFVAAGAGLGMGDALLRPGPWRRAVALRRAAIEAVYLVAGAAALLVLAAIFEAFVSPSSLPPLGKAAVGLGNAALLALYLGKAGRLA